jgi:hypothetical protein
MHSAARASENAAARRTAGADPQAGGAVRAARRAGSA